MDFSSIWSAVERVILKRSGCILIVDYDFFILNENSLKFIQKQKNRLKCSSNIEIVIPKSTLIRLKENIEHNEIPYTYKAKRAYTQIKRFLLKKKDKKSIPVKIDMENSFDYSQAGKYFIKHPKRYEIETYSVAKSYYQKYKRDVFILTTNKILEHLCRRDSKILCINPFLELLEKPFRYGFTLDTTIFLDYPYILDELIQNSSTYIFIPKKVVEEIANLSNIQKRLNSYIKDVKEMLNKIEEEGGNIQNIEGIKERIETINSAILELENPQIQNIDSIEQIKSHLNRIENSTKKILNFIKLNSNNSSFVNSLIKLKESIGNKRKRVLKTKSALLAREEIEKHIRIYTDLLKSKENLSYFLAISNRYNRFSENILSKKYDLNFKDRVDGNDNFILAETLELRDIVERVFLLSNDMRLCVEANSMGIFPISSRDLKVFELLKSVEI